MPVLKWFRPVLPVVLAVALLHATSTSTLRAQDHDHPAGDVSQLGRVVFPVSCGEAVQPHFERAVAMLHSFWFEAALAAFDELIMGAPSCAMAHWGRAVTLMGNPMTRASPSATALRSGLAAAERARELAARASHREQMYADAVVAYYRDHENSDHLTRMLRLEAALEALHRAHPDDMEAAIFHARTLVANAPPDDHTFERLLRAARLMDPLFRDHRQHPGLAHYLIHAYDVPQLAEQGREAAFAYASIAPAAPHALHMPSHIFTRLGYWDESIETNARSAQAEPVPDAAVHPMDYMVYAYLQQGRTADAREVVSRAVVNASEQFYGGLLGYNFVAMQARYALELDAWSDAAQLRVPTGSLPYIEAVTRFSRGIGAARSDRIAQARDEVATLVRLVDALKAANDNYWSTVVDAQRLVVQAWITRADGTIDEALRTAREAADLEETVEKHPVTPGPILPARELLGDMLLELGRAAEAQSEYERVLQREPRRSRALYGAARAAEAAGRHDAAAAHYRELLEVMTKGEPDRPAIRAAGRFLEALPR